MVINLDKCPVYLLKGHFSCVPRVAVHEREDPANTWYSPNAVSMLAHSLRLWANMEQLRVNAPVVIAYCCTVNNNIVCIDYINIDTYMLNR